MLRSVERLVWVKLTQMVLHPFSMEEWNERLFGEGNVFPSSEIKLEKVHSSRS